MTHTPTPEQLQEFKDWLHKTYKSNVQEFNPNFLPHLEDLCEAYAHHKLMKKSSLMDELNKEAFLEFVKEGEDDSIAVMQIPESIYDDITDELRKVAALQECLTMQQDIIAKKDKMQSALQKELDDCYKNYDNIKQQLTEANAEIERLKGIVDAYEQGSIKSHQ